MKKTKRLQLFGQLFTSTLAISLTAAALPVYALSDEQPWYQVEVIIFSQQDMFNEEPPRTDIELSYPADSWVQLRESATPKESTISPAINANTSDPIAEEPTKEPFTLLSKELHQLSPDHFTLRRTPGYRVLFHQAWQQPGLNLKNSPWVIVQGGKENSGHYELEGSLRLVKTRHLHIQADLWKTRFRGGTLTQTKSPWPQLPDRPSYQKTKQSVETPSGESNSTINNILDIVTLKQSLKLSLDELSYLDHPNMGVLVLVNKLPLNRE